MNVALEQIKLAICEADLRIEEMQKLIQNTKQLSLVDELKRFAVIEGVLAKRQMHALTCINQVVRSNAAQQRVADDDLVRRIRRFVR